MSLAQEISNALRSHVSSGMPIRLLLLPTLKLIERREIYAHLLPKMSSITEEYIADKINSTKWDNVAFVSTKEERRKLVINNAIKERAEYAILSHTWLVDEPEVTYPDWVATPPKFDEKGKGYVKLKNFADVAYREHGMTLAWLDTLCINKDSTSELDESIRSMYRWYLNSALCIIILAETEKLEEVPKDRWFTRGWTLQELLAPKRLKFYGKSWTQLLEGPNDKQYEEKQKTGDNTAGPSNLAVFGPLIEEATGITLSELRTFDPKATRRNIPTRMVWASKRVTSREEDAAYCLMGIFGVSFSIAYGEGRERAFFRLLEAIITSYRDILAILDWSGKPIGEDVHATALLPAGPECYKHLPGEARLESNTWHQIENYVPFTFTPREPMALTHLGLQVDLYCVPATVASVADENDGVFKVKLQPAFKFCEEPIEITVYPHTVQRFRTDDDDGEGWGNEFMIGIWTFEKDMHGDVYIPGKHKPCRAFILESRDWAQPIEMVRVWTKVNTPEVIRISPDEDYPDVFWKDKISVQTFIL